MNRDERDHEKKEKREESRSKMLKGKGYTKGGHAANVGSDSYAGSTRSRAEEKQMKAEQTPLSTAQAVGYNMRGARKVLGIRRDKDRDGDRD